MNWAIDENVLAVANDHARIESGVESATPQASAACRLACIRFLRGAQEGVVLLDDRGLALRYYRRKASLSGQPGTADAFLKFVYENQYNERLVMVIDIGESPNFNLDQDIVSSSFDIDDQIYIALSLSAPPSEVVNAVDADYSENAEMLISKGVSVRELC